MARKNLRDEETPDEDDDDGDGGDGDYGEDDLAELHDRMANAAAASAREGARQIGNAAAASIVGAGLRAARPIAGFLRDLGDALGDALTGFAGPSDEDEDDADGEEDPSIIDVEAIETPDAGARDRMKARRAKASKRLDDIRERRRR